MSKIDFDLQSPFPMRGKDNNQYLDSLNLGTIYGENTHPKGRVYMTQDQVKKWYETPVPLASRKEGERERLAFARSQGIEWIDPVNARYDKLTGQHYLFEVPPPRLTYWAPYHREREVILNLAQALAGGKQAPTIVEVGCGSGIVTRLLAADSNARVIGIDPDIEDMGGDRIPATLGKVELYATDAWSAVKALEPIYEGEHAKRRDELLAKLKPYSDKPVFEYFGHGNFNAQEGDISALNTELNALQRVNCQFKEPSPVDLALCSFMDTGKELTVPIRDGIHPKAIVYVRPINGMSGGGDYYLDTTFDEKDGEERAPNPDSAISYNPGRNYTTVARWLSHNTIDWKSYNKPPKFGELSSEVVVQIRNDQVIDPYPNLEIPRHPFDADFVKSFVPRSDFLNFMKGIKKASRQLFSQ